MWSAGHRWTAIGLWLFAVVIATLLGSAAGTVQLADADVAQGGPHNAATAQQILAGTDFGEAPRESVLIESRSGPLRADRVDAAVAALRAEYAEVAEVSTVGRPVRSKDGWAVLLPVELRASDSAAAQRAGAAKPSDAVGPVLAATGRVGQRFTDLRIDQVGGASIDRSVDQQLARDFQRAELLSLPVTLVVLLVVFGALLAAGVPLLLGVTSVVMALGLCAVASHAVPQVDNQSNLVLLIGLAVGVDYSLFAVHRARRERGRGLAPHSAIDVAAGTSLRAVVVSGCTVVAAMSGMFLAGSGLFSSFAVGTILVVGIAVLGSVTVIPAVMSLLGERLYRTHIPLLRRVVGRHEDSRFWLWVLRPVLRRPAVALLVGVAAMVALAVPMLGMRTADPDEHDLPRSLPAVAAYDRLTAAFPEEGGEHTVVVRTDPARMPAVQAALRRIADRTATDDRFRPGARAVVSLDRTVARLDVPIAGDERSANARATRDALRADQAPAELDGLGVTWAVGGVAFGLDFADQLSQRLPWVVGFVLALTFVLVLVAFRSVPLAAVTVLLNALSVAAAYGILVAVFQWDVFGGRLPLNTGTGAITDWLPMLMFVVLFGLSMDYHVFVVSRVREFLDTGLPEREAIRHGVASSAGVVTSAAAIMVAVFSIFGAMSLVPMQQLGVGLAAAILLDATVVRGVLLPAALALVWRRKRMAPLAAAAAAAAVPAAAPASGG
jgi:RND superfamily putative drug exporter